MADTKKVKSRPVSVEVCMIETCGEPVSGRGLCKSHYGMAKSGIASKRIPSWEFLVERGMAKATLQEADPFHKKLKEAGI